MRTWFLLLLVMLAMCSKRQTEFANFKEFQDAQTEAGYVRVASFEPVKWPAKIVEERTADDEISFHRPNGTPHKYAGYDGYTLKFIRLRGADGEEAVCVYRSKSKR